MMKLADMPSCLGGGDHRTKKIASSYFSKLPRGGSTPSPTAGYFGFIVN